MCLLLLNPDMETEFEEHSFFLTFLFRVENLFRSSSHPDKSNTVLKGYGHLQYTKNPLFKLLTNGEEGSGYFCLT